MQCIQTQPNKIREIFNDPRFVRDEDIYTSFTYLKTYIVMSEGHAICSEIFNTITELSTGEHLPEETTQNQS